MFKLKSIIALTSLVFSVFFISSISAFSTSGTLTSAQIKTLHSSPIEIIPAPGVGKIIVGGLVVGKLNYGGNDAFIAGGLQNVSFYWGSSLVNKFCNCLQTTTLISNFSKYDVGGSPTYINGLPSANIENTPVYIGNPYPTEISGNSANDNTIYYTIFYDILIIP